MSRDLRHLVEKKHRKWRAIQLIKRDGRNPPTKILNEYRLINKKVKKGVKEAKRRGLFDNVGSQVDI